ncbi:hypothetical protein [Sulfobacillus sp. hq2]|uniref:hypothetical protein n=1 Tax=Sulfobacillus sp. hq2 TaxID=2039167 RepID=UPI000CD30D44|nr:hypothetical protein [Sulfobacillus sp. hq2]POB11421.1 hypothetical protein CO251_04570 [Sulfobacillus sp. hq2]
MIAKLLRFWWVLFVVIGVVWWLWPTSRVIQRVPVKAAPVSLLAREQFIMHYASPVDQRLWVQSGRPPIRFSPVDNILYFTPRPSGPDGNIPLALRWPRSPANQHILSQLVGSPAVVSNGIPVAWTFHAVKP